MGAAHRRRSGRCRWPPSDLLADHRDHWLVREIGLYWARTFKRLDLSARTLVTLVEPGSCFVGTLAELVLAADQSFMLDGTFEDDRPARSPPRADGRERRPVSRCRTVSPGWPAGSMATTDALDAARARIGKELLAADAAELGLVTFTPDDIDWDEEVRLMLEERASFSPDALTGDGGQLPLRRTRDDGDEDLRPPHGVAELGVPAAQRGRARRRAAALRHWLPTRLRPERECEPWPTVDYDSLIPNNVDLAERPATAAGAGVVAAAVHRVVEDARPRRLPGQGRVPPHGHRRSARKDGPTSTT